MIVFQHKTCLIVLVIELENVNGMIKNVKLVILLVVKIKIFGHVLK